MKRDNTPKLFTQQMLVLNMALLSGLLSSPPLPRSLPCCVLSPPERYLFRRHCYSQQVSVLS